MTASYNGSSQSATVTVTPPAASLALSSVSVVPSSLPSGEFATLSVTINGIAPPSGAAVSIQTSNSTAFPAPSLVMVPAGQSTNGVPVEAGSVGISTSVTVTATYGGATRNTDLTVTPSAPNLLSVTPTVFQPQLTIGSPSATVGLQIANQLPGTLTGTIAASTTNGTGWLTVDGHASETWAAPAGISVTANPAGLGAGIYAGTLTITAPAASNSPVTIPVTMTILAPPQITTTSLPTATSGQFYSFQLQPSGVGGNAWTESGSFPSSLTLSASGLISGTLPAAGYSQSFTFTVGLTNSSGLSTTRQFTLTVQPPIVVSTLTAGSFQFTIGQTYVEPPYGNNTVSFLAAGGATPYIWAAGGLPPGLRIDATSGFVVGTPTQSGTFPATITATDSQGRTGILTLSLVVATLPLVFTTATLPTGTVGITYSQFVNVTGGSNAGYQWTVQGSLPPGVTSQTPIGSTGLQFAGTPSQAGTFNFTVKVTDSLNDSAQQPFSLIINAGTPPRITTSTLTLATVGQSYSFPFVASGGAPPYRWSLAGAYDPGLQLSAAGVLSGTSTQPNDCVTGPDVWVGGQYPSVTFQVNVTDAANQSTVAQFCLPAYYPAPQVTGFAPSTIVVDGQTHTITVNGANFRSNASIHGGNLAGGLQTTFLNSGQLSFTLAPQEGSAFSGINEGSTAFWIMQPYTNGSNQDKTIAIYDPVPTISSVQAVLNNSTQPCQANLGCQLVIHGAGLVYSTQYQVTQGGQSLFVVQSPSTPIPWNTVTTSVFSVPSAGTYTVQVANGNQPGGGNATAMAQFTVIQ